MLRIQVLNAQNLPIPTAKERKTRIYCYSFSSGHYLYDSFKNNENTRNPVWEESFDVELFRCSRLYFKLFSSRLLSEEIFLGDVNIDVLSFLNQKPGSEILKSPYGTIRCEFKLSNCQSSNSVLNLSFTYTPTPYNPIDIKDVSKSRIHLWTTYSPLPTNPSSVINIELLQATVYKNKDKSESDTFLHFSKSHSWEDVGYSSMDNQVLGPTGPTQIRTFYMKRISEKYNFFIINSIEAARNVLINSYALLFMLERGTLSYNRLDYYVDNLSTVFHKTVSYLRGPSKEVPIDALNQAIQNLLFYANLINF